jgi:ATP-dependent Clp protease ATP-binding subunit ClpA
VSDREKLYLIALIVAFTLLYFKISKGVEEIYVLLALLYIGVSFFTFKEYLIRKILKADIITLSLLSIFAITVSIPSLVSISPIFFVVALISFFWSIFYKIKLVFGKKESRKAEKEVKLPSLEEYLKSRIVGQDEAVKEITKQITINIKKSEAKNTVPRVLGTFIFVGPTGVGKTETVKALAEWFNYKFGHQFLRFDMGNFSDYHTASTLVGSPKGYIGNEEGGALTRPLMHNPKAVILFDEIEKSHPSLYRTFMSLIDEGEIQEISTGIRVILNQSPIIFTSNLFQKTITKILESSLDNVRKELLIRDILTGKYNEAVELVGNETINEDLSNISSTRSFPPEFIGRIDKIVPFKPLSFQDLMNITYNVFLSYGQDIDNETIINITRKYEPIAKEYGVRVFIKKLEEEML